MGGGRRKKAGLHFCEAMAAGRAQRPSPAAGGVQLLRPVFPRTCQYMQTKEKQPRAALPPPAPAGLPPRGSPHATAGPPRPSPGPSSGPARPGRPGKGAPAPAPPAPAPHPGTHPQGGKVDIHQTFCRRIVRHFPVSSVFFAFFSSVLNNSEAAYPLPEAAVNCAELLSFLPPFPSSLKPRRVETLQHWEGLAGGGMMDRWMVGGGGGGGGRRR